MMMWLKACPRCRGDLFLDSDYYGNYVCCIQCGHTLDESRQSVLQQRLLAGSAAARLPEVSAALRTRGEKVA